MHYCTWKGFLLFTAFTIHVFIGPLIYQMNIILQTELLNKTFSLGGLESFLHAKFLNAPTFFRCSRVQLVWYMVKAFFHLYAYGILHAGTLR